jgi:hypothetical protein
MVVTSPAAAATTTAVTDSIVLLLLLVVLLVLPLWWPLLTECSHAFLLIFSSKQTVKHAPLKVQPFSQVELISTVHCFLCHHHCSVCVWCVAVAEKLRSASNAIGFHRVCLNTTQVRAVDLLAIVTIATAL